MSINIRLTRISGISSRLLFALAAVFSLAAPAPAQGQSPVSLKQVVDASHIPSPQKVAEAAITINGISPSTIPTQSITVGGLDGATGRFYFSLDGIYPPNLPENKKCTNEQGEPPSPRGCVPPQYVAQINSFNVEYVFGIANKPPDLSISITLQNASGQTVSQPVPIDATGRNAAVSFHPYSFQKQFVSFTGTFGSLRRTITVSIRPYLRPQLGAFVVKHLLLAIVYEPPGSLSSSSFELSNTTGTTTSFNFTGGYGIVDTVDTGALLKTISNVAGGGSGALKVLGMAGWTAAGTIAPYVAAAGQVAQFLQTLGGSTATTTTTVYTQGTSNSSGWSMTVTETCSTGGVHKYPGHGDKFAFLDDVLFVYLVVNDRVQLAPVAFTYYRCMTIDELQAQDPALAAKWGPLDVLLNPDAARLADCSTQSNFPNLNYPNLPSFIRPVPRVCWFSTPACEVSCSSYQECTGLDLTTTGYTSTGTSQTTAQTISTVHTPSLMESMLGQKTPDGYYTTTYTTSTEKWQQSAKATKIKLGCPEFAPTAHNVYLYIDNAFGTFLGFPGPPVPPVQGIRGRVAQPSAPKAPAPGPTPGLSGVQPNVTSPSSSSPPQVATKMQPAEHCCTITTVDARTAVVTARQTTGSQTLQFTAPRGVLPNLKVGQRVWVDYQTQLVSVEAAPNCCRLVAPPPARPGTAAPR